jgi:hypothetical protein
MEVMDFLPPIGARIDDAAVSARGDVLLLCHLAGNDQQVSEHVAVFRGCSLDA